MTAPLLLVVMALVSTAEVTERYNISPTDTPFSTMAGKGSMSAVFHEWQTEVLEPPDTSNAHIEGDDIATFPAATPTVRVGNYSQIMRGLVLVSKTLDAVDKAGRNTELAHQVMKVGKEVKRDSEAIMLENQGADAGSSSTARLLASLGAWVKTNTDFGATGADPVYTNGAPAAGRTDGTQRPFTETILQVVLESCFINGAEVDTLMVGPFNKQVVSQFQGIATRNYDLSNVDPRPTAVIASIDVYVGDFYTLRVIPNRFQRERDAWVLDSDMVSIRALRPFNTTPLATTGDATKRMLIVEHTLRVNNEAGLGLAADLDVA